MRRRPRQSRCSRCLSAHLRPEQAARTTFCQPAAPMPCSSDGFEWWVCALQWVQWGRLRALPVAVPPGERAPGSSSLPHPPTYVLWGCDAAPQAQTLCSLLSLEIPSPLAASPSSLISIQERRAPPAKRCSPCRRSEWPICCQLRSRGESPPELQQQGQRPPHWQGLGFYSERWLCNSRPVENLPVSSRPSYQPHHPAGPQVSWTDRKPGTTLVPESNERCSRR